MTPQQSAVLEALRHKLNPVAIHELEVFAVSENSVGSRLPELKLMGLVECRVRPKTRLKEWWVKGACQDASKSLKKADNIHNPPVWSGELPLGQETPLEQLVGGF